MIQKQITDFTIKSNETILTALEKINDNQHGFLIVVSSKNKLVGTLTDGDIRRALVNGASIEDEIANYYQMRCKSVCVKDEVAAVIDIFKEQSIDFLPIIDSEQTLVNLITRKQLHAILLKDLHVTLNFDFIKLDETIVDYEIFQRPWGFYKTTVLNDYFQSKIIHVKPGAALSLQMHNHREEHWIIVHGNGKVQIGESFIQVQGGSSLFIPKGCKHRLMNTSETESLILTEVQIGDYFGEDDIIRFEDIYGRV